MHPGDVPSDLRVDTTGERVGDGVYRIDLPDAWNYQMPSGGVLMSTSLRAMQSELFDDTFRPASATTIFCEPVPHGRLVCEVTVLRKGNLATQVRSSLRHESSTKTAMETIATFTRDRPGIRVRDAVFPEVPMPRDARAWEEPPIGVARKNARRQTQSISKLAPPRTARGGFNFARGIIRPGFSPTSERGLSTSTSKGGREASVLSTPSTSSPLGSCPRATVPFAPWMRVRQVRAC